MKRDSPLLHISVLWQKLIFTVFLVGWSVCGCLPSEAEEVCAGLSPTTEGFFAILANRSPGSTQTISSEQVLRANFVVDSKGEELGLFRGEFRLNPNFKLDFSVKSLSLNFLTRLFADGDIQLFSRGEIDHSGFHPEHSEILTGKNVYEKIHFSPDHANAVSIYKGTEETFLELARTFDSLSIFLQIILDYQKQDTDRVTNHVLYKNRIRAYHYEYIGDVTLTLSSSSYCAKQIDVYRGDELKRVVYLLPQHHGLIGAIDFIKRGKTSYRIRIIPASIQDSRYPSLEAEE